MKIKFQNPLSRFLVAFLGLLGFLTACESADLYGSPYASFKINGTVTDKDKKPVSNAKVNLLGTSNSQLTNSDGTFELSSQHYSGYGKQMLVTTCDGYINDTIVFEMNFKGEKKNDEWYCGHCDTTINPVISKLAEPEENQNPENSEDNK